ncbi:MAG: DUF2304 domain-containing protein [Thermodesulfobacteriota bacterium]|nr:DUF2304 domain-containing protein [Thermodesulfobacteriota bacterium]
MTIRQKIVAILIAVAIFTIIIELVRRRRLREEYSWLWLVTGFIIILMTVKYELLLGITNLIGAVLPVSTLFFFSIIFLILLCLQFSVRISRLTDRLKNVTQELTILKAEMDEIKSTMAK